MTEATAPSAGARLHFTGNALPLFGRYFFAFLASILVVPAPWMAAWFSKWFVDQTEAEDGTQITFEGQGAEIWLPMMLIALVGWGGSWPWPQMWAPTLGTMRPLVLIPINLLLYFMVLRWLIASLRLNGARVSFDGSYWPYLGYYLFYLVSILSIIGWAWVMAAWLRWLCRNIAGDVVVSFSGKGHEILWRCLVGLLGGLCVIPIPWMMAWLTKWFMSQITIEHGSGAMDTTERVLVKARNFPTKLSTLWTVLFLVGSAQVVQGQELPSAPERVRPLMVGALMPAAALQTSAGEEFDLGSALAAKSAVLIFYRGGW